MSIQLFANKKENKQKIVGVTCYDFWSAKIIEKTAIDFVLVGDSAAMVMHGKESTLPIGVEELSWHTKAVARGLRDTFLVADMPFLSFRKNLSHAMNAVESLMKAGAHGIKIEGVDGHETIIKHIVNSGIPVMGHLGLIPQSVHGLGGYRVQGRADAQKILMMKQAKQLQDLGCFSLVLECVVPSLAEQITDSLDITTIGIGSGVNCDGQILVLQDLLGLSGNKTPKFVRSFLNGNQIISEALENYSQSVQNKSFPNLDETYGE